MHDAVIINAVRTPIGALGGILSKFRPDDLAAVVLNKMIELSGLDPLHIEEVYMGVAQIKLEKTIETLLGWLHC